MLNEKRKLKNSNQPRIDKAVKLSGGLGTFLKEQHKKLRLKPLKERDNQSTPQESFLIASALFYWYMEESINWLKLAEKTFEHLLEQSESPHLEEYYELKKSDTSLSPHNHTKESKGG